MKNLLCAIILIISFVASPLQAQILLHGAQEDRFEELWNGTLSVVVTGKDEFDESVKAALEKYWKVCDYEFISESTFENNIPDESKFFLVPVTISHENGVNSWLAILRGGVKNITRYADSSPICYAPFDKYGYEKNIEDAAYRMGIMIKSMNDACFLAKEKNLRGKGPGIATQLMEIYKKRASILKRKTLLIPEELLENENVRGKPTIKADDLSFYDFKYEIKPLETIIKLMESGSEEYCFFFTAIDHNKMSFAYDLETKSIVFADLDFMGIYIKKKDFKEMNDIIRGDI